VDQGRLLALAAAESAGGGAAQSRGLVSAAITARGLLAAADDLLGSDEARRELEVLLSHALGRDRAWLYAHADDALPAEQAIRFHQLLVRRAAGEPVAYLIGSREFWSLDLVVTSDVLIPRPETELLVELALQKIPQAEKVEIADLGTGSGAIALALARERPRARVLATDVNDAALVVARANAQRLAIGNIEFAQGNWCDALGSHAIDVIVSNPPYIAENDAHLTQGDLRFEPRAALASGSDGLDAIRAIVGGAPPHLKPGGWLLLEHGFEQGAVVRDLLARGGFAEVATACDLEGRERVAVGRVV
jgi:release factor glutamine methyltransferase